MLKRSTKITEKTIEMRTGQFPVIKETGPFGSATDGEKNEKDSYESISFDNLSIDIDDKKKNDEMDDAVKTVYTDVVLNGLRDAGIDVSGLEQGIIEPLGTRFATDDKQTRKAKREAADIANAINSYSDKNKNDDIDNIITSNDASDASTKRFQHTVNTFTRFDTNLPDIEMPTFNMPSGKRFAGNANGKQVNATSTVETVSGIKYSEALGNTGAMTALDPQMLAAHGMYAKNISESARRAFMAATAREDADESTRNMTPLGTARGTKTSGVHIATATVAAGTRFASQNDNRNAWHTVNAPQHAAKNGQKGTAASLIEKGYRKSNDDTSTFVAIAEEEARSGGKRFSSVSPDDTSTFVALAEKSKELIENGIGSDTTTSFDKIKHVAKLAGAETPIALALVAVMTLGLGGMAATGKLSTSGSMTNGIGNSVNSIIGQISGMTTQASAETTQTDDTASYPHETINMSDVLTGQQTQVMSWTGYCSDGWWFAGDTEPTDILPGSGQERVHNAWNAAGSVFTNNVATLNGRYLVAVKPALGQAGQYIDITLDNGTVIPAIIADTKGNENYGATDYKYVHSDGSIIELEVNADYGIDKSTGNVKSSGNVQTWIPEWASLVKSVTKYERYV